MATKAVLARTPTPDVPIGAWARCAAAAGVLLVVAAFSIPLAHSGVWLPDSVEHMAIAHAWIHGAGFVDPVQWTYETRMSVPLPAVEVRPPLVSVLLAIPMVLGASMSTLFTLHAVWSALAVGATVWVGSRWMRLPAAVALGLCFGLSPIWVLIASQPLTEATGVLAYLAVLATARGVLRSAPAALACAALTILAWLTRPNLGAVWLAVVAAAVWELGPRRSLRCAPLWLYTLGFAGLAIVVRLWLAAATGGLLYSGYGGRLREIDYHDLWRYGNVHTGTWSYVQQHADQIATIMLKHLVLVVQSLFLSTAFNWVGWILAPGVVWALLRSRDGILEHRISALCTMGFAFTVVLNYSAYEPRYVVFPALAGGLCGFAMLDDWARRAERRILSRAASASVRRVSALPLAVAMLVVGVGSLPWTLEYVLQSWQQSHDRVLNDPRRHPFAPLCRHLDRDAIVATTDPWMMVVVCGNAALRLPTDLAEPTLRERFIADRHPAYFVVGPDSDYAWLRTWDRVRELARSSDEVLYELRDPSPQSRPWRAPPALVCGEPGANCEGSRREADARTGSGGR
jgi:hypothetical protein